MIRKSHKLLELFIHSRTSYNMLDEQAWTEYINLDDPAIIKTLEVFKDRKAFPQAPDPEDGTEEDADE